MIYDIYLYCKHTELSGNFPIPAVRSSPCSASYSDRNHLWGGGGIALRNQQLPQMVLERIDGCTVTVEHAFRDFPIQLT